MFKKCICNCLFAFAASLLLLASGCTYLFYQPTKGSLLLNPEVIEKQKENISLQSSDGIELKGWWFSRRMGVPKGVIVQFHGNAQNMTSHFANQYWVTDLGFELFVFDYRGYGDSSGSPSQRGLAMDGQAALIYAAERFEKMRKECRRCVLVAYGQSLGGNILLHSLTDLPVKTAGSIHAVVIEGSFLNFRSMGADVLSRIWFLWPFQWLGHLLVSNELNPEIATKNLSLKPLIVIHSRDDKVVPVRFGEELFEKANGRKKAIWVPTGGHLSAMFQGDGKYRKELFEAIETFRIEDELKR